MENMDRILNLDSFHLDDEWNSKDFVLQDEDFTKLRIRKQSDNLALAQNRRRKAPRFGICFDIDGVLARGSDPLPAAIEGFKKIIDNRGRLVVPVAFVTNALNRNTDKSMQISRWLKVPIYPEQMIQSPCPLEVFTQMHDKFCLVVGQGKMLDIAKEMGFKSLCTMEDVIAAYPLLDVVDHDNRTKLTQEGYVENTEFHRIEVILLLGEPKRWESALQILVDLLRTDGKPNVKHDALPERHLPVVACNMDLEFMERACMPRYGHGAFLVCLEALYKKIVGKELQYTALMGKPSEITYRYAEHALTKESRRLGYNEPIKTMYFIGDNPESDIAGSNLYQRYIDRLRRRRYIASVSRIDPNSKEGRILERIDPELPMSRNIPPSVKFFQQTVESVEAILVCTGCYTPGNTPPEVEGEDRTHHGHRDFAKNSELYRPTLICDDVDTAIDYILEKEEICF